MDTQFNKLIKNFHLWVGGFISLATALISFVFLLQGNYQLGLTILGILVFIIVFFLFIYIAFTKEIPLIEGGKGVYRFKKYITISRIGLFFLLVSIGLIFLYKPSRIFILTAFTGKADELVFIDLTKDKTIKFKYGTDQLEATYQTLNFIVANTGDNDFVLDRVTLEITDINPYYVTMFPEGPLAPHLVREYEVSISPQKNHYLVTDENMVYKAGDVEEFYVELNSSDEGYIYEVLPGIEWYNLEEPKIRKKTNLNPHLIDFPGIFHLSDLLKACNKIDYFLDNDEAVSYFVKVDEENGYAMPQTSNRLLIDKRMHSLNISGGQNLLVRYFSWDQIEYINHSHYSKKFFENLEKIKNIQQYYFVSGAQYLILHGLKGTINSGELIIELESESAIVIQHTCCHEAEIIWKIKDVESYIKHFDQFWEANKLNLQMEKAMEKTYICLSNRKLLYDACNRYLMDTSKDVNAIDYLINSNDVPNWDGPYIKEIPKCPDDGIYSIEATYNTGMITVQCSKHGSSLSIE
jgi:hypothetical protein